MSKSRRIVKRELARLRKPVPMIPNKVEIPKTAYDRARDKKVDQDDGAYNDLCLSDVLDQVVDTASVGVLSHERLQGMLKMVLKQQPGDQGQSVRRARAIEVLSSLLVKTRPIGQGQR